jgi:hypothetical protein
MTYFYQYDGKTFEVTITEVDPKKVQAMTTNTTEDDGGIEDNEAKPPKKPRIPLIIVFPY